MERPLSRKGHSLDKTAIGGFFSTFKIRFLPNLDRFWWTAKGFVEAPEGCGTGTARDDQSLPRGRLHRKRYHQRSQGATRAGGLGASKKMI